MIQKAAEKADKWNLWVRGEIVIVKVRNSSKFGSQPIRSVSYWEKQNRKVRTFKKNDFKLEKSFSCNQHLK